MFTKLVKKLFLIFYLIVYPQKYYEICKSQNKDKENKFLKKIQKSIKNKYFVEIGFHSLEFNCIGLIEKGFSGLLIDGGRSININITKIILFLIKKNNIKVINSFLTIKNVKKYLKSKKIGCISIDIDGNDFWILKTILKSKIFPEVIVVEYNASLMNKSLTIPYYPNFNRFGFHKSGFYHGASLSAYYKLLKNKGYHLVKCIGGVNAVFINNDIKIKNKLKSFKPSQIYQEGEKRNKISKSNAKEQYLLINKLPFKKV